MVIYLICTYEMQLRVLQISSYMYRCMQMCMAHAIVTYMNIIASGPQYRPQYTMILIMGVPQKGTPTVGRPP